MITQREALKRPVEQAAVLRSVGPALASFSIIGLILMWITGVALVFLKCGSFCALPSMFWIKFIFISTLTLAAITTHVLYGQVKGANVAAATRLPVFSQIAGMSSLLAMIFAALAFH